MQVHHQQFMNIIMMVILKRERIFIKVIYRIKFRFVYKNNHIEKLFYLVNGGMSKKDLKPTEIIFKYKFDKQKNWTEIIKNVNGNDLYKWVREIQYY